MAMKEIRLELDESKLNAIIMELDILHRAVHPNIVEFYGAFFIESCVYYCMEFMNGGSLDKLYTPNVGLPEGVLAFVTESIVQGLRFLKDELQVMHRGVLDIDNLFASSDHITQMSNLRMFSSMIKAPLRYVISAFLGNLKSLWRRPTLVASLTWPFVQSTWIRRIY